MRRVILAGISNAGAYLTPFVNNESQGQGVLSEMLAGVWNFNSDASQTGAGAPDPSGFIVVPTVQRRLYYQQKTVAQFDYNTGVTIPADVSRWSDYQNQSTLGEIPPLPPLASNSAIGGDLGNDNQDVVGSFVYAHHLIRDFMFLDAARSDDPAQGGADNVVPTGERLFTAVLNQTVLQPVFGAPLALYTRGVGPQSYNKLLLASNGSEVTDTSKPAFSFASKMVGYSALLYELQGQDADKTSPNWFGVVVPAGQVKVNWSSVVIYFHPRPRQANYFDTDYPNKATMSGFTKNGVRHADWKQLFGYVDRLGAQLAGAIIDNQDCGQVVIVPFMQESDAGTAGILPTQWYFIVSDILASVMSLRASGQI
ncbi:hypothetical protein AB3X96_39205 [Paraburkholderia sp. BR13439]|uniref:hypothetical protein n=1 Tax=Paraburkholderia sp. BR13439 TaxID=3236996 RepID=UPI0034CEAD30